MSYLTAKPKKDSILRWIRRDRISRLSASLIQDGTQDIYCLLLQDNPGPFASLTLSYASGDRKFEKQFADKKVILKSDDVEIAFYRQSGISKLVTFINSDVFVVEKTTSLNTVNVLSLGKSPIFSHERNVVGETLGIVKILTDTQPNELVSLMAFVFYLSQSNSI